MSAPVDDVRVARSSGRSMYPLIRDGSEVGIRPVEAGRIAPGDLVAFRSVDRTLVHRVLEIRGDGGEQMLREKGDGNSSSSWISARDVTGRAVWVGAGGGLRRIHPPASPLAVRLLTRASRVEAAVADSLRARIAPGGAGAAAAAAAGRLLLPLKVLALPLLSAAYPAYSLDDDASAAEREFLLACFRRDFDPAAPVTGGGLDASLLLQGAVAHGIGPAVLRWSGDALPPEIAGALRRNLLRAGLAHLNALETLREACAALRAAAVPHLVLKGPALAHLYPSGAERAAADLDLLVAPADRERARAALAAAGYRGPAGAAARLVDRLHFHTALAPAAKDRVPIELHWGLTDRACLARIPVDEVLGRRAGRDHGTASIPVPAAVDEFLYLAVHAARHGIHNRAGLRAGRPAAWFLRPCVGNRLLWFGDLHRYFARHGASLDAPTLRARAADWNVEEELAEVMGLLRQMLPGPVADAACERCGVPRPDHPRARATRRVASPHGSRLSRRLMRMDARLLFRPARLAGLGRTLFPSPERLRSYWRPRHRTLLPLLRLVHPFHIALRVLRAGGR